LFVHAERVTQKYKKLCDVSDYFSANYVQFRVHNISLQNQR